MGGYVNLDPSRIKPAAGVMVVQIVEVLGGTTKGGLFLPGTMSDHSGKDTCLVRVMKKGDPPRQRFVTNQTDGRSTVKECKPWESRATDSIGVGDVACMPRDVPLVFVWDDCRYALVYEHEAICAMSMETFEEGGFEVIPWKPNEVNL